MKRTMNNEAITEVITFVPSRDGVSPEYLGSYNEYLQGLERDYSNVTMVAFKMENDAEESTEGFAYHVMAEEEFRDLLD